MFGALNSRTLKEIVGVLKQVVVTRSSPVSSLFLESTLPKPVGALAGLGVRGSLLGFRV